MKATELMIRNLVNITKAAQKDLWDINEIEVKSNCYEIARLEIDELNLFVDGEEIEFNYAEIEPIELNDEWLTRFGFTGGNKCYKDASSIDILKTDFYLRPSYLGGYYWGFNVDDAKLDCELNDVRPLKYVHQLQNLIFALTNEELTLK